MASSNVEANRILKPRRRLVQEQQFDNTNSNNGEKKANATDGYVSREQDVILGYAQTLLRNFLQERGFERTLSVFDTELKKMNYAAPSIKAWYDMSSYLDLASLSEQNKRRDHVCPSLIEMLVREMVESKLGTIKNSPIRRRRGSSIGNLSQSSLSGGGSSLIHTRKPRLEPLAHIKVPEGKLKVTSAKDRLLAEKRIRDDARRESRRSSAAANKLQLKSKSVTELQHDLHKSLGPSQRSKQASKRKRRKARDKINQGLIDSSGAMSPGSPVDLMGSPTFIDLDEDLDEATVTRQFMAKRSKESWIPWDVRFKMLRKNMAIQKENALGNAVWEDLLEKNEVDLDYLSIARSQEKYSGKNKKKCALCRLEFLNVNLPLKISFKAILDLRQKWGLHGGDDGGMLAKVPRCYDKVSICRYCAQFFQNTSTYRPSPADAILDEHGNKMSPHSPTANSPSQRTALSKQFLLGTGGKSMNEIRQSTRVTVEIFSAGDGKNYPKKGNWVMIHYNAYLSGGAMFDSSRDRLKPLRFRIGAEQVIPGLNSGISQLSVGERAKLIVPPNLGFGENGLPGLVPGGSILIYDVELLSFSEH